MSNAIGNVISSLAIDLNALAAAIIKMAPRVMDYLVPAAVTLINAWLSYLSMIGTTITILGNYVKRFITTLERALRTGVSETVEQVSRILLRLGQPTSMVTYIGALVNSMITTASVQMRRAVNKIVDFCTGLLARVISRVKSMMDPLVNRKPGSSTEKPVAPEQPNKDDSNDKPPSQEDPIEIKPVA